MNLSSSDVDAHTHPCVRCGAPVPLERSLCEECNPLDLAQPASSQAHGWVALGIVLAVIALAFVGRLSLAGIGPFDAEVVNIAPAPDGLTVTLSVRNAGTSAGTTRCRITDPAARGTGPAEFVLSPVVGPRTRIEFETTVAQFGKAPKALIADCHSP